jgi:hypothetical protein
MDTFKKIIAKIAPPPAKDADGRDQWPSRTAFILASLSGVIGMGNFLRYPSQSSTTMGYSGSYLIFWHSRYWQSLLWPSNLLRVMRTVEVL